MKTPDQALQDMSRYLGRTWHQHVTDTTTPWRDQYPLGHPTGAELEAAFTTYAALARQWAQFAHTHQVPVRTTIRRVAGTTQQLPTHLVVSDLDTAAALLGDPWPARLRRARDRDQMLRETFTHLDCAARARVVRAVDAWSPADVELLITAGKWFTTRTGAGLTPRQVPIEGLHAKWLNSSQHLVCLLAGRDTLDLAPPHPPRVHLTYLDPAHRTAGGRRHDAVTVGDTVTLPYTPQVVLISENKDTAVWFPPVPGAVAIEGQGAAATVIAALDWVRQCPHVFYWGDMDADGLEILARLRSTGLEVTSILMDLDAYQTWCRYGTNVDARGNPLAARAADPVTEHLTAQERALYTLLTDPQFPGYRRVEQERIPLHLAQAHLTTHAPARP